MSLDMKLPGAPDDLKEDGAVADDSKNPPPDGDDEGDDFDDDDDDDDDFEEDDDDLDEDEDIEDVLQAFESTDWDKAERVTDMPPAKLEALLFAALECVRANGDLPSDPSEAHVALFEAGGNDFLTQYRKRPHAQLPWHREAIAS